MVVPTHIMTGSDVRSYGLIGDEENHSDETTILLADSLCQNGSDNYWLVTLSDDYSHAGRTSTFCRSSHLYGSLENEKHAKWPNYSITWRRRSGTWKLTCSLSSKANTCWEPEVAINFSTQNNDWKSDTNAEGVAPANFIYSVWQTARPCVAYLVHPDASIFDPYRAYMAELLT